jgi:hypothetical protein
LAQSSHHGLSGLLQENGWLGWSFWGGATVSMMSVGQNWPHWGVVRCQVIILV